jgi:hypothetical protein
MARTENEACISCGRARPPRQFVSLRDGAPRVCKSCRQALASLRSNGIYRRNIRIKLYPIGLTNRDLTLRLITIRQRGGCCEACGSTEKIQVDHDHRNGWIRGILCLRCNSALGFLGDDVRRLELLYLYLLQVPKRRTRRPRRRSK